MQTTYEDMVTEARRLVKRSEEDQWRLAELTWEAINVKDRTQAEWASDIGKSRTHVRTLVKVFTKWQTSSHRPSFWDAYDSANQADVTTPEEARQFKEDQRAGTAVRAASPDRRAAIAEELLDDPEVQERMRERSIRGEERRSADPSTQKFDTLDAALDLTDLCRAFASGLTELLPRMSELPNDPILRFYVDRAIEGADILRTFRDTGRTDLDAFLESVLKGGS